MYQSDEFAKKQEENPSIVQRKNSASFTKPGYDEPLREKPIRREQALSSQKSPIQRYLIIGNEKDKDSTTYQGALSEEIKDNLVNSFGASKEAVLLLDEIASNDKKNQFSDWSSAVTWATVKTQKIDAIDYLNQPDRMDMEDDQIDQEDEQFEEKVQHNYSISSSEQYQMPLENIGDKGERLVKKWLSELGIKVTSEQNQSGHGLDVTFEITKEQILSLPKEVQGIFSNVLPPVKTKSSSGRIIKPKNTETETNFLVILEIKANSAQMSKAQKNPDSYVIKQSKKGFAVELREKIDKQMLEVCYEVRVSLEDRSKTDVNFTFKPNEMEKQPMNGTVINYDPKEQSSHISPKEIGDIGEKWTREQLIKLGYTQVTSLQKVGGQGVDLVGKDPEGMFTFFEVKSHLGSGKGPKLTKREKKQASFVSEIVLNIMNHAGGYINVDDNVYEQVREIYNQAIHEDQERREEENLPIVGMDAVNFDGVISEYLAKRARYFVMNVFLPNLGTSGQISGNFLDWKAPKKSQKLLKESEDLDEDSEVNLGKRGRSKSLLSEPEKNITNRQKQE